MIRLPYPPTLNHLFANSASGGRHKTPAYKAWIWDATLSCRAAPRHSGPVQARILAHRPDNRKRDLDNLPKSVFDLLKRAEVIGDDSDVQSFWIGWSDRTPSKDAWIEVEVTPA